MEIKLSKKEIEKLSETKRIIFSRQAAKFAKKK